jgi:hypothetical protein
LDVFAKYFIANFVFSAFFISDEQFSAHELFYMTGAKLVREGLLRRIKIKVGFVKIKEYDFFGSLPVSYRQGF